MVKKRFPLQVAPSFRQKLQEMKIKAMTNGIEISLRDLTDKIANSIAFHDIENEIIEQNNDSRLKTDKKSASGNIKVILFPENNFITTIDKTYANKEDEHVSKFINAVSSLIYNDSKIKSLETIGKIIEPQINFFFEF